MPTSPAAPTLTSAGAPRLLTALALLWAALTLLQFGLAPATLDFDMFHEMALARQFLTSGHFPYHDTFAYTPTLDPIIHHEWAMGLLLYALSPAGLPGLYLLLLLLIAAILTTCLAVARRRGASWPAIILCTLLAGPLGLVAYGAIRAQFITVLFMALQLLLLESARRPGGGGTTRRAWIPLWLILFVLWVNFHGGFLVGLGILLCTILEDLLRRYLTPSPLHPVTPSPTATPTPRYPDTPILLPAVLLASLALTGVSPYGYALPARVLSGALTPRPIIPEWNPLWTDHIRFAAFLLSLVLLVYALRKNIGKPSPGFLLILITALLALRHTRHSSLYAVAWLCYVPAWLSATPLSAALSAFCTRRAKLLLPILLLFLLLSALPMILRRQFRIFMPTAPADISALDVAYPVGPVAYLADHHFHGNLFTPFDMGAFISWKLAPAVKVSIDSRYEVAYAPDLAAEMVAFYDARPTWQSTLTRYPPDLILTRNSAQVAPLLAADPQWKRIYIDDVYSLYAHPDLAPTTRDLPLTDRRGQPLLPTFP